VNRYTIFPAVALVAVALSLGAVCTPCEWVYAGRWGTYGDDNGEFNCPTGVAVAPNGAVYVADKFNHRVQYFTATGSFLGKWGKFGLAKGEFAYPCGVAVAPDGKVYVVDSIVGRVQCFTSAGSLLGGWRPGGFLRKRFGMPSSVAISPDGRRGYVADQVLCSVQYFRHR
jgi:tripartite motif-containing protein 71